MSGEKIFIEKFGKKYYCLRQRNTIKHCQSHCKNKIGSPLNIHNKSENCNRKKKTSNNEKIVKHHELEVEENGLYKCVDRLENMVSFKVAFFKIIFFTLNK